MGLSVGPSRSQPVGPPEAGELVPVDAIDRTGLMITSDGAFVRVLHVLPPNPLIVSDEDRRRTAAGFCHLAGRLRPGGSVQSRRYRDRSCAARP